MSLVQLTPGQRRRVRDRLGRAAAAGHSRRLLAILELDRGRTAAEVADLLRVTRQSVYNWAAAFTADPDPAALRDHHGGGHPGAWTDELRAALVAAASQSQRGSAKCGAVKFIYQLLRPEVLSQTPGSSQTPPRRLWTLDLGLWASLSRHPP